MTKSIKTLVAVVMILVLCFSTLTVFASAEENGISPRLSHMAGGTFSFSAGDYGGEAYLSYDGYSASFVSARVTFQLQKRFLLVLWNDKDEWTATSTELRGFFAHTFELESKGTYRVNMTLEVTGKDGTVDVITDTIESTY